MRMRAAGLVAAIVTSGCSTLPELPGEEKISIRRVVDRIQCELGEVVRQNPKERSWLMSWAAGFTLTLRVEEQGSVTPNASSLVALAGGPGGDLFGAGLSATGGANAKRIATMTSRVRLQDAGKFHCEFPPGTGLEGGLGIGEWLDRSVGSTDSKEASKRPRSIGYTVEFVVLKSGRASADFTLLPVKPPGNFGFGLLGAAQRADTHTLDIAFADATPPGPQEVIVVKLPVDDKSAFGLDARKQPDKSITIRVQPGGGGGGDLIDRQLDQLQFRNELRR